MKVVLDECIPTDFRHELIGHEVFSVAYLGLRQTNDQKLLRTLAGDYDAFLTVDRGIRWQTSIDDLEIAVVVLRARTNKLVDVQPFTEELLRLLPLLVPGSITELQQPA